MFTVICDIDGVIADCTHRLGHIEKKPADWDAFFNACSEDEPLPAMIRFLREIQLLFRIVYVTGRPERTRQKTVNWFAAYGVPWKESYSLMFMREDGDHRQDFEIKREILTRYLSRGEVVAVIEDRDQVVQMWREEGLLCLQPKKGDY